MDDRETYEMNTDDKHRSTFASKSVLRLLPPAAWTEAKALIHLMWPVTLAEAFLMMLGTIGIAFSGHLGRQQLDAIALAVSLMNVTGMSIGIGLLCGADTLFSQAYGSPNKILVGIYLQQVLLLMWLTWLAILGLLLNAAALLTLAGQEFEISIMAGEYLLYFSPALLLIFTVITLFKWLQNQNHVRCTAILSCTGIVCDIGFQYVFVYLLNLGIKGTAIGHAVTFLILLIATPALIKARNLCTHTWTGWSWQCLDNWGQIAALGIPAIAMFAFEWWIFEIGIILCGYLGQIELAASSITFSLENIFYMAPFGMAQACTIRVGNLLGAGRTQDARTAAIVAQTLSLCIFVCMGIMLAVFRNLLPYIFTTDPEVIERTSGFILILIGVQFLDSIVATSGGAIRGTGRQKVGAIVTIISSTVGLPIGIALMFRTELKAAGFWYGIWFILSPIAVIFICFQVFFMNWDKETERTKERLSTDANSCNGYFTPEKSTEYGTIQSEDGDRSTISMDSLQTDESRSMLPVEGRHIPHALLLRRIIIVFCFILLLFAGILCRNFTHPASRYCGTSNSTYVYHNQSSIYCT